MCCITHENITLAINNNINYIITNCICRNILIDIFRRSLLCFWVKFRYYKQIEVCIHISLLVTEICFIIYFNAFHLIQFFTSL